MVSTSRLKTKALTSSRYNSSNTKRLSGAIESRLSGTSFSNKASTVMAWSSAGKEAIQVASALGSQSCLIYRLKG
jgi:hypothetical protein